MPEAILCFRTRRPCSHRRGRFHFAADAGIYAGRKYVFVPDYARGIAVLDRAAKRTWWLPMNRQFALQGIDGMYFSRGSLLAVQNGTAPERVVAFRLTPTFDRVLSQRIIESATARIDPTHGVIVGSNFYYIANSGWNELGDDGAVRRGQRLTPARIMVTHLR